MVRFCDGWRPELLVEPLLPSSVGALVDVIEEVDTATSPLVVETRVRVLLPLTVIIVVTSCSVLLLIDTETGLVGLLVAVTLDSVDVDPNTDGADVEDTEVEAVVEKDSRFEDKAEVKAVVVLPGLLLAIDVSGTDELKVVVRAGEVDDEPEAPVVLPDEAGVEGVATPVLRAPIPCRRWRASSTFNAVIIESSIKSE